MILQKQFVTSHKAGKGYKAWQRQWQRLFTSGKHARLLPHRAVLRETHELHLVVTCRMLQWSSQIPDLSLRCCGRTTRELYMNFAMLYKSVSKFWPIKSFIKRLLPNFATKCGSTTWIMGCTFHTDSSLDLVFLKKIKSVRCYCWSQLRFTKSENLVKSKSLIFIM